MNRDGLRNKLCQALDDLDHIAPNGYNIHKFTIDEDVLDPEAGDYDPNCKATILFDYGLEQATRPKDSASAEDSLPVTHTWMSRNAFRLSVEMKGCHMEQYSWVEDSVGSTPDPEETDEPE